MIYDVPFRHQQALNPSGLPTITTTLRAIEKAVEDCRNAGVDPDSDPAVVLLARHMAVGRGPCCARPATVGSKI